MKFIAQDAKGVSQEVLMLPGMDDPIKVKDGFFDVPPRLAHLARSHGLKAAVITPEDLSRAPVIAPKAAAPAPAAKADEGF